MSDESSNEATNTEQLEKIEKQIDNLRWAVGILIVVVSLISSYLILQVPGGIIIGLFIVTIFLCIHLLRASCSITHKQ